MLHTINKAPDHSCFDACLRVCAADTAVLLIEDGVLAAIAGSAAAARQVYVLLPDAAARGVSDRLEPGIVGVDHAGFVQLCCEHTVVQSWY